MILKNFNSSAFLRSFQWDETRFSWENQFTLSVPVALNCRERTSAPPSYRTTRACSQKQRLMHNVIMIMIMIMIMILIMIVSSGHIIR